MGRFALIALVLGAASVAPAGPGRPVEADSCTVYAYIDGSGNLVKTTRQHQVQTDYRASLMTYRDCAEAQALADSGGSAVGPAPFGAGPVRPGVQYGQENSSRPARAWRLRSWFSGLKTLEAVLLILFLAAALAGQIGLVVTAFRVGVWWGLGSLFVPAVGWVFGIVNWRDVWPSFLFNLGGGIGLAIMLLWAAPI